MDCDPKRRVCDLKKKYDGSVSLATELLGTQGQQAASALTLLADTRAP